MMEEVIKGGAVRRERERENERERERMHMCKYPTECSR